MQLFTASANDATAGGHKDGNGEWLGYPGGPSNFSAEGVFKNGTVTLQFRKRQGVGWGGPITVTDAAGNVELTDVGAVTVDLPADCNVRGVISGADPGAVIHSDVSRLSLKW